MTSLTMVGSNSLQIHHFQIGTRITTKTTTTNLVVSAAAKSGEGGPNSKNSFKTGGKFDSKNRKTTSTTTTLKQQQEQDDNNEKQLNGFQGGERISDRMSDGVWVSDEEIQARLRELPGLEKDFWEGPEWDTFGFLVQYLWAFGILFALVACGVAVATYNEGAADFKQTPAYKESIQSRDFLEEPESSNSDIFESNPTEEAPALE